MPPLRIRGTGRNGPIIRAPAGSCCRRIRPRHTRAYRLLKAIMETAVNDQLITRKPLPHQGAGRKRRLSGASPRSPKSTRRPTPSGGSGRAGEPRYSRSRHHRRGLIHPTILPHRCADVAPELRCAGGDLAARVAGDHASGREPAPLGRRRRPRFSAARSLLGFSRSFSARKEVTSQGAARGAATWSANVPQVPEGGLAGSGA